MSATEVKAESSAPARNTEHITEIESKILFGAIFRDEEARVAIRKTAKFYIFHYSFRRKGLEDFYGNQLTVSNVVEILKFQATQKGEPNRLFAALPGGDVEVAVRRALDIAYHVNRKNRLSEMKKKLKSGELSQKDYDEYLSEYVEPASFQTTKRQVICARSTGFSVGLLQFTSPKQKDLHTLLSVSICGGNDQFARAAARPRLIDRLGRLLHLDPNYSA